MGFYGALDKIKDMKIKQGLCKAVLLKIMTTLVLLLPLQALASPPQGYNEMHTLNSLLESWLFKSKQLAGIMTSTPVFIMVLLLIFFCCYQAIMKRITTEEALLFSKMAIVFVSTNHVLSLVLEQV